VQRERIISSKLVHIEQMIGLKFSPLLQTEQKQSLSVTSVMIVKHVYLLCLIVYSDIYNNLLLIMK
jgi:hypothetical protein